MLVFHNAVLRRLLYLLVHNLQPRLRNLGRNTPTLQKEEFYRMPYMLSINIMKLTMGKKMTACGKLILQSYYASKNLTTCSKSANKPSRSLTSVDREFAFRCKQVRKGAF